MLFQSCFYIISGIKVVKKQVNKLCPRRYFNQTNTNLSEN
jgi:hypothetical protein